jgi:NADH-quinone oxidoreductase subunit K
MLETSYPLGYCLLSIELYNLKTKIILYKMDLLTFIIIPTITFFIGISGIIFNKKNAILVLISVELMLLAINFIFLVSSVYLDDRIGQIFALLILTVAAAESSIGLGLLVVYYRIQGSVSIESINLMRG